MANPYNDLYMLLAKSASKLSTEFTIKAGNHSSIIQPVSGCNDKIFPEPVILTNDQCKRFVALMVEHMSVVLADVLEVKIVGNVTIVEETPECQMKASSSSDPEKKSI